MGATGGGRYVDGGSQNGSRPGDALNEPRPATHHGHVIVTDPAKWPGESD